MHVGTPVGVEVLEGGIGVRLLMSPVPEMPTLCVQGVIQKGPLGL